ncbi:urease subunit beta [Actinophytocola sp.]|uniref:urease subunit beta n=1 Tax=Actinophytocola sp. TaxID=1872138 RepID=UPI003899C260
MSVVPGEIVPGKDSTPIPFNDPPTGWPPEDWKSQRWQQERPWRHTVRVRNNGDRAIQVGSHFHFYEVNPGFDEDDSQRAGKVGHRLGGLVVVDDEDVVVSPEEKERLTAGYRLDIPAGTARRFEPGYSCDVRLVALSGRGTVFGLSTQGTLLKYTWTPASKKESREETQEESRPEVSEDDRIDGDD